MNSGLAFWGPFLVIFGTALLVSVVQRYARDVCLMKFDCFHVIIQMKDGKWHWGTLKVHSKAVELVYAQPMATPAGNELLTRVFYESNIADIAFLLRPEPAPGSSAHTKWVREMQRLRNPPLLDRIARNLHNVFSMLRNAFSESISLIVGMVKQRTAVGKIAGVDQKATEAGQKLLATIPSNYEPILEHYLSREVAAESYRDVANPNAGVALRIGVLAAYSDKFLLLRDVLLGERLPAEALRSHDAHDRFAILLPRTNSFIRHLARRAEPSPAVAAMAQEAAPGLSDRGAHPEESSLAART